MKPLRPQKDEICVQNPTFGEKGKKYEYNRLCLRDFESYYGDGVRRDVCAGTLVCISHGQVCDDRRNDYVGISEPALWVLQGAVVLLWGEVLRACSQGEYGGVGMLKCNM